MPHEMKRTVKDSVFTYLFKQPEYTLQLYKALHPEDTDVTEADCEIITLENIIFNDIYNDLGIRVKNMLIILIEAQSTFTLNIALRMFLYLAATYKNFVDEGSLDLYGSKAVTLPCPELYVVYTGDRKDIPETMCLSGLFANTGKPDIEVTVHILRRKSTQSIIDQYIRFCEICDEQRKKYGYTEKTIEETIRICINEGILVPFLLERKKEVNDIMSLLFSQERIMEIHDHRIMTESMEKGREEGREEGRKEGIAVGIEKGREEGRMEERNHMVQLLMDRFNLSPEEAQAAVEGR